MVRSIILLLAVIALLSGCSTYAVPGGAADFRALGVTPDDAAAQTDASIAHRLDRKPLASFPATIAVVRLQDRGYRSYTSWGYGSGDATVVTTRDVETDADFERFLRLPMVRAVVPLNRMVLPECIRSEKDLRNAAASVQADMTLLYTFDTRFGTETVVPALGVITLGLFPSKEARVTATASAALVDTRNGYVYALAEATAKEEQLTNAWHSESAVDQARRAAERAAFEGLLAELESSWKAVAERYAVAPAAAAQAVVPLPVRKAAASDAIGATYRTVPGAAR